ncbi:MAG: GNAT family N-acetyltransferase [Mycobacteriales bacterium]
MAWVGVAVPPGRRRRGIGTAIARQVIDDMHRQGRTLMLSDLLVPDPAGNHPYRAFARSLGFSLGNTEIVRHLRLPIETALLDRLDDQIRTGYAGQYTIETHVNGVPEDLRSSLCAAYNRLATDAPSGAVDFEEESMNPERYALGLELLEQTGATQLTTVGLTHDREVAAYTDLMLPKSEPDRAHQWDPGHRAPSWPPTRHGGEDCQPSRAAAAASGPDGGRDLECGDQPLHGLRQ